MAVKSFKFNSTIQRIGLLTGLLVCLIAVFFFAKWSLANSIATRVNSKEVADFTTGLAPADPQTHYALAVLYEKSFLPEDLSKALEEYERATALSPYDFRLWLSLGNARGQSGDTQGAEKAFRRALELAPNYSQIQWALGNNLVRQGKTVEGFAEIRRAARGNPDYIRPTISTAWTLFDGDMDEIKKHIGDSPEINAEMAIFLTRDKKFSEALEIWNSLPAEQKRTTFRKTGDEFYRALVEAKKLRFAFQVYSQIRPENETADLAVERIHNSGFETDVNPKDAGDFEWRLGEGLKPQIGFDDTQKHGGKRSLVMVFNSTQGKTFRTVSQVVIVEPDKTYELEFFYRSDLKSGSGLKWLVLDASADKLLVASEVLENNPEWTAVKTSFKTGEATEAIVIQLVREDCQARICPISGKVWFDDFSIR